MCDSSLNTTAEWLMTAAQAWYSYASRQSDAYQLRRQSLQCS